MTSVTVWHPREDRAVAIDLDGVLLDGMTFHISAWKTAFDAYGVQLDPHLLYRLEGIKSRDVIDRICKIHSLDLSESERDSIAHAKKEAYKLVFEPLPLEGAGEFLETLRTHGYRMAIVTGTVAAAAVATLEKLGMRSYVELIVSGDQNIPGKPDPAPFREAARRLETQPAAHCLAVDNAPAGITSAIAAGLPCVAVATYLPRIELAQADLVFDDLFELTSWIDREHEKTAGRGPWDLTFQP